jgi:hypothetical protein
MILISVPLIILFTQTVIMNFWTNIFRYPRFFLSSMIGLGLILVTSILKITKAAPDKKILIIFFCFFIGLFSLILHLMLNLNYD